MEVIKKCTNCGYYPFCDRIENRVDFCNKWRKRKVEMKLEKVDGLNFVFKKL